MDESLRTRLVPRRPDRVKSSSTGNISSLRSFSSSSSSVLLSDDSSLLGVPFSWEKLPGEPKELSYHLKTESTKIILPLPPHRNNFLPAAEKHYSPHTTRKKNTSSTAMRDPFTAALVECSKGGVIADREYSGGESSKAMRKSSIGLVNLYASCRRTCEVAKSIVYLPRSVDGVASHNHLLVSTRLHRR